jgi:membrane fusion protein, heavy metal efflux system
MMNPPRIHRIPVPVLSAAFAVAMVMAMGCGKSNATEKAHGHSEDKAAPKDKDHPGASDRPVHISAAQRKDFGIQIAVARPGTLKLMLALTGEVTLNPNRVAHLVPSISGVARKVHKQLGDPVVKGELMAELASRELARMNASYLASQAKGALAWTEYLREKKLYAKGVSSQREYQRAKLAMSKASVETQLFRRKLQALGLSAKDIRQVARDSARRMSHYELRAPFAGVVVEKHITHGEYLKADTQAFTVANLSDVWIELKIYQKDLVLVRRGQSVEVAASYGRLQAKGKISYVSPLLNRSTRTAGARVVLDNKEGKWQPGLFVTATVTTDQVEVPVLVRRAAIQQREGKPCIFVEAGDAFTCRPVTLGRGNNQHVAVVKGLTPGARYVAKGGFVLKSEQNKSSFGDGHAH